MGQIRGHEKPDPIQAAMDLALVKKADEHDASCNGYEADRLDDLLKQVERGAVLREIDRTWVIRLIEILNQRGTSDD